MGEGGGDICIAADMDASTPQALGMAQGPSSAGWVCSREMLQQPGITQELCDLVPATQPNYIPFPSCRAGG